MSDDPLSSYYQPEEACDWLGIYNFYQGCFERKEQWVYRGHGDPKWKLKSTIDRQFEGYDISNSDRASVERGLVRRFRRECHRFVEHPPSHESDLEWISLMRHFGAPCRVLDWTYSFFVALYFAIEEAVYVDERFNCSVFCFDLDWLKPLYAQMLLATDQPVLWAAYDGPEVFLRRETVRLFLFNATRPARLVAAVTPFHLNARLGVQQSTFLCPGDVRVDFDENMAYMLQHCGNEPKQHFIKLSIQVTRDERNSILRRLQSMNMNRSTLYPGLQGFAESLKTLMADPEHLLGPGASAEDYDR